MVFIAFSLVLIFLLIIENGRCHDEFSQFKPILVTIEGNIGAGKTTLLQELRQRNPHWTFIDEPVDMWLALKNEDDEHLLEVFFRDRKRWSYTFQTCVLMTVHQYIESAVEKAKNQSLSGTQVFITERCMDTGYHVFAKMLMKEGSMGILEAELYFMLLTKLKAVSTPLSAIIHLNTPPEVCVDRIKSRGREGEQDISLEYLAGIHQAQDDWIVSQDHVKRLTLDDSSVEKVEEFINGLL